MPALAAVERTSRERNLPPTTVLESTSAAGIGRQVALIPEDDRASIILAQGAEQ